MSERPEAPLLREVREDDLDVFFEQQRDPEAMSMALMPARDREAFDAHWRRILADEGAVIRTIDAGGEVAGNVLSWQLEGRQLVGYWVGREFWGRGLATAALRERSCRSWRRGRCMPGSPPATSARSACSRSAASSGWARPASTTSGSARSLEMFLYQLD